MVRIRERGSSLSLEPFLCTQRSPAQAFLLERCCSLAALAQDLEATWSSKAPADLSRAELGQLEAVQRSLASTSVSEAPWRLGGVSG